MTDGVRSCHAADIHQHDIRSVHIARELHRTTRAVAIEFMAEEKYLPLFVRLFGCDKNKIRKMSQFTVFIYFHLACTIYYERVCLCLWYYLISSGQRLLYRKKWTVIMIQRRWLFEPMDSKFNNFLSLINHYNNSMEFCSFCSTFQSMPAAYWKQKKITINFLKH